MAPPPARFLAIVLLALSVITAVIVIIIWQAAEPKKPKYTVERGSISGYNLTDDGRLNASFHFLLRSYNPSRRVSFYYDKVLVKVSYENRNLSVGHVNPFYQQRRSATDLELNTEARDVAVRGAAAEHLRMERDSGDVRLELKIIAKIRLKIGVFKVRRTLEALCGSITVPFSPAKGFNRAPCDVDISL